MKKISMISKAAAAAVVGSALLVGCGSSSTSTTTTTPPPSGTTIGGSAVDGYLKSSIVTYRVLNDDNTTTDFDTVTNADDTGKGAFSYTFDAGTTVSKVIVKGGFDVDTQSEFKNKWLSGLVYGTSVNVTPLTSLVAEAYEHNSTRFGDSEANATTTIAAALGISEAQLKSDIYTENNATVVTNAIAIVNALDILDVNTTEGLNVMGNIGIRLAVLNDQNISNAINTIDNNSSVVMGRVLNKEISGQKAKAVTMAQFVQSDVFKNAITNKTVSVASLATTIKSIVKDIKAGGAVPTVAEAGDAITKASIIDRLMNIDLSSLDNIIFDQAAATDYNLTQLTDVNTTLTDGNETAIIQAANDAVTPDANQTMIADLFEDRTDILNAQNLAILSNKIAVDKISLKNDKITIGDTTVTVSGGSFGTISHDLVDINSLADLYTVTFGLENESIAQFGLEDGESKAVTLGISIASQDTAQRLFVTLEGVTIHRSGTTTGVDTLTNAESQTYVGEYSATVDAGAALTGYAIKASDTSTAISAIVTNGVANTSAMTESGGDITYDFSNAITKFEESNPNFTDLKDYLTTNKGKYDVRLFISGVDGVDVAKDAAANISGDFTGYASTIDGLFPAASTKEISGTVIVGYSASDLITEDVSNLTLCSDLNLTADITLPTEGANGSTISWASTNTSAITTAGVITRTTADQSATLTATISLSGATTQTKTFDVVVKADLNLEGVANAKTAYADAYTGGALTAASGVASLDLNDTTAAGVASDNGVTVTWTKAVDGGTATTVSGTDTIDTTTAAQSIVYTATFTKSTASDTASYTYTLAVDSNRALSAVDSNATASVSTASASSVDVIFTVDAVDGYGNTASSGTVTFNDGSASTTYGTLSATSCEISSGSCNVTYTTMPTDGGSLVDDSISIPVKTALGDTIGTYTITVTGVNPGSGASINYSITN